MSTTLLLIALCILIVNTIRHDKHTRELKKISRYNRLLARRIEFLEEHVDLEVSTLTDSFCLLRDDVSIFTERKTPEQDHNEDEELADLIKNSTDVI